MIYVIISAIVLIAIATFLKIKRNINIGILAMISMIILFINGFIIFVDYKSRTDCEEVWSGKITSVEHNEEWDEYHPAWDEEITTTDKKGKKHTKTIHHPAYTEHHNATNYITTSDEGSKEVTETLDGKPFTDSFVNSNTELEEYYPIGMPTASVHIYENKVQASYSVYKHQSVNLDEYPDLPDYPKTVKNYTIDRIIGNVPDKDDCLKLLNKYNSELNDTGNPNNLDGKKSYKQINIIFVNLGDVTDDYGFALQDYWQGGNKNDFVVAFGSNNDKITWCYPFSWSDSEMVKIQVKDYMMQHTNLNEFKETIGNISDLLENGYERKQFADFNYLEIEVSTAAKIIMFIFTVIGIIVMFKSKDISDYFNYL